ncbi:hypothetical protein GCM10007874_25360 [Labrys miyagiensis]|uniref:Glyoxalase n=1 Tax=Labrys miyagiensis TaxID=346912 RepID=A0ABQ6CIB9_9HYPH|nr:glyoxalase [Labrys miyagiensis]GLS19519.1 hypothetical protein GCM10007874_25360 [Labrys miyagiensis]
MIAFRFRALVVALAYLALLGGASAQTSTDYSVGPQYDSTHVYVEPGDFARFVASFIATFGGTASKQGVFQVTPTPSQTLSQIVATPVGIVSVFGFRTPVPYPFGEERTGYLVSDIDAAVGAAVNSGAMRLVDTFPDPIGRDALIQWPGGVNMQLYWHTVKPNYPPLATVPENRVYLTADAADAFLSRWLAFSRGKIVSDDAKAPGVEVGRPGDTIRRIRISSGFGALVVFVSDGKLPWPYGRDLTGYEVGNLEATLARAKAAGVEILVPSYAVDGRRAVIVRFPGGYIAEIHAPT